MKLGEYPPFKSHVAPRLQRMLTPEDLDLYRKGLRAERDGLGIAAAAYYRRVVENQWQDLISKLQDAARMNGASPATLEEFEQAKKETRFSKAVERLKNAIPERLLIADGQNPLVLLHRPLSIQLHELSDSQWMEQAEAIRTVLNALFENIIRVQSDFTALGSAVRALRQPTPPAATATIKPPQQ